MRILFTTLLLLMIWLPVSAQIIIDVHPNFRHAVEGVDTFDRANMVKIHADHVEGEWGLGNNFGNFTDLRDTFLNGLDVYMGRNTGGISWYSNQVFEDPNRPGFADSVNVATRGQNARNSYANNTSIHAYEARNELVIAAQQHPFYPDGTPTGQGWAFANGTATGEYMAHYINNFHGSNGPPEPPYVEIMNEPLYDLVTVGDEEPVDVFQFHNEVADAIRARNSTVQIGGYTAAFPNFEVNDFQRWHDRWKLFIDMSGDRMDYWSIHFYDFNLSWSNTQELRRGSNMEATLDMLEHYSMLKLNEIKPLVISEFGGRALTLESGPWTPYRDWMSMKSWTSMLLAYGERPQLILSAIPFVIVKAEWGRQPDGDPYPWRLMRKNNELAGQTGEHWVYTEFVKFYQLWSEVNGTRVDSRSTDPDVQCNTYVEGNKMYVVLNNLYFQDTTVNLNLVEQTGNPIQNIHVKHLHLNTAGDAPLLDESNPATLNSVQIGAEGSVVIEYTYQNPVAMDEGVDETKYYADTYLTPIIPYAEHSFQVNGVNKTPLGEAVLRLGMGRDHGKNLRPNVKINGFDLEVPTNYMGYDQGPRATWFGVIEVPVPYYYLQADNEITVQFPDAGGYISSLALRVYNHTDSVFHSDAILATNLTLAPAVKQMTPGMNFQFVPTISPVNAIDHTVRWTSDDPAVATVDSLGNVSALMLGMANITAATPDGVLMATSMVEVLDSIAPVSVLAIELNPDSFLLNPGQQLQMQATISPIDATDPSVIWSVSDPVIATIDNNGRLTAHFDGMVEVIATTTDGGLADTSVIEIERLYNTSMSCTFFPATLEQDTAYEVDLSYSTGYAADLILELLDENQMVIGTGETMVQPGFGTEPIQVSLPNAPAPGENYSWRATIKATGMDSVLVSCTKENVRVIFPPL
ncbi:MAG: Ig-like domain-containing protein [Bacteroidota bacterium]